MVLQKDETQKLRCRDGSQVCRFLQSGGLKRVKITVVLILSVIAAANSGSARLGDGSDKIEDSYGEIMQRRLRDDGMVSVVYKKDRYLYFVTFANDRSILESYCHVKGTDLSEKEITRFLKANAAGGTWTADNTGTARRFKRSDGNAEATYAPVNGRPALTVRELRSDHRGDQ
jgi:hypothetical protein